MCVYCWSNYDQVNWIILLNDKTLFQLSVLDTSGDKFMHETLRLASLYAVEIICENTVSFKIFSSMLKYKHFYLAYLRVCSQNISKYQIPETNKIQN